MTTLAICNHKGGTGKTTTAIHVGAALGLCGFRTLIIDLDPQSFLSRMVGIRETQPEASSLALFEHDITVDQLSLVKFRSFDVLPASMGLVKRMRRLNRPIDVFWVKEALKGQTNYDVVLLDTAAAVTVYSLNALAAAHSVLIPVTPEYQPVIGAEETWRTAQEVHRSLNPDLKTPFFLITRVDRRKREHYKYRKFLRERYGDQIMQAIVRTSASLASSCVDGVTVFEKMVHSRGAIDYANVTDEIIRRVGLKHIEPGHVHDNA